MNADPLDQLLGIDRSDPLQDLACRLVQADSDLMNRLIMARHASGLSTFQVANRMCATVAAVTALERTDADPKLSTLRRYALAIGVLVEHKVLPPSSSVDEGNPDR